MTSFVLNKEGSLASVTSGEGFVLPNGQVSLHLYGTFSATMQLQARRAGSANTFAPVIPLGATSPDLTAAGAYAFPFMGGDIEYQVACTAHTSGTANYSLNGGPRA